MKRTLGVLALVMVAGGCNCSNTGLVGTGNDGGGSDSGMQQRNDAGVPPNCTTSSMDLTGCDCATLGATRSCYPSSAPPSTAGIGACRTGTQACEAQGELYVFGPCTGAVTPQPENCTSGQDLNCNGKVGCADPACANDPSCNTGCDAGETRSCYTGDAGTENVGACHDGVQTCVNGQWSGTCSGEVLPSNEDCCAFKDLNCNGLYGCFDFLAGCEFAPCCQVGACAQDAGPGCSCPQGAGDGQTCPMGTHIITVGPNLDEACCPCTASSCGDLNCCGTAACANASQCNSMQCSSTLPASCNGMVDTDCDDWPEDCDEPCCLCSQCDGGVCAPQGGLCNFNSDCCSQSCDSSSGTCN